MRYSVMLTEMNKRLGFAQMESRREHPRFSKRRRQQEFYKGYAVAMTKALEIVSEEYERDQRKAQIRAAK